MNTLLWILCAGGILLIASLLPVLPVEKTAVVAPIPDSDGRLHDPLPQDAIVSLAVLLVPVSGASYGLSSWSWIVLSVLVIASAYLGRSLSRRILRRRNQQRPVDPA